MVNLSRPRSPREGPISLFREGCMNDLFSEYIIIEYNELDNSINNKNNKLLDIKTIGDTQVMIETISENNIKFIL